MNDEAVNRTFKKNGGPIMPPRDERDMRKYATKGMLWGLVPMLGIVVTLVVGVGFSMSANHIEKIIKANNETMTAINGAQGKIIDRQIERVKRLEGKQEQDHEMIKNVEARLTGIETALKILVDKAQGK